MGIDALITIAVLLAMVAGLVSSRVSPPVGVVGATAVLFVVGVIDAESAFSGFSNPAPLTVAGLYVVAEGIGKTGGLTPFLRLVLSPQGSHRGSLSRLIVPAAGASSFLANTPIVAMLVPEITKWADRRGLSSSRFLIPLSYATILGGTLTVVGTSTNLVVSGLLVEAGGEPLGMFELTKVSLPVAIVGVFAILVLSPLLLPDRGRPRDREEQNGRPFTVSMKVAADGGLHGETVSGADLRNLDGVYLAELRRGATVIAPVKPEQTLLTNDVLVFVGQVDQVVDLHTRKGLEASEGNPLDELVKPSTGTSGTPTATRAENKTRREHGFFEAVLGPTSPLVGHTLAEVEFRARYQGAVVGIHRSGEAVTGKLGEIRLHTGDTLLILAGRDFRARWRDRGDFLLVSRLDGPDLTASKKAPFAGIALAAIVLLPLLGLLSVTRSTVLAAGLTVVFGVLSPREARDAVDINVVMMIGGAFGLGEAVRQTGLADQIASGITNSFGTFGSVGVVVGLIIATMALTELVTNAAAAALILPTALSLADGLELDPRIVAITIAVAASSSFLTPIGYQTNTMVYGPGGYRFGDYLRLGIPLSIISIVGLAQMVTIFG